MSRRDPIEDMAQLQNDQSLGDLAVGLGYFDTLMSCSGSSTSSELSNEERATAGISPGLVRVSIGDIRGAFSLSWDSADAGGQ